jgi:signal transduction histidine kinase
LQRELLAQSQDLASKNAELEAYAHTIAHSLQTPLAAANRFLEILDKFKSADLTGEQHDLVKQARAALEMTGEVVDALLLLSTLAQQRVELHPIDMGAVVGQVLRQLADLKERTHAALRLPKSWPQAIGFAPWVGEVWLNLLTNAFKYGGSPPSVELGGSAQGAQVRFWVRDNGQPLSEQERSRIFIPFTRLHRERAAGHGLGLATVHRIVSKLGGEVGVGPGPEGGNEFFFELPAVGRK